MKPKFRAWDKRFSEFVEDFFVSEDGKIYKKSTNTGYGIAISRETSDKVILMQSTGLFDKNGKEIFEGDVVRMRNPRDRRQIGMFQVVRVANSPMLGLLCKKLTTEIFNLYEHMRNYYEVKGNIYENPELLEDKE